MARRHLNDDELKEIASKEWKKTPIFTSDEKKAYQAKNLTGPKTVEGKMKALKNLRVGKNPNDAPTIKHGGYVQKLLNQDEQDLYFARREDYLRDYDINGSADEITLHQVLMEEVIYFRLMKAQSDRPSMDIDRPLNDCTRRLRTALEDLGALRKQRLKQDEKQTAISIATIAQQFHKALMAGDIQAQLEANKKEEEEFLKMKQSRDRENTYEADLDEEEDE